MPSVTSYAKAAQGSAHHRPLEDIHSSPAQTVPIFPLGVVLSWVFPIQFYPASHQTLCRCMHGNQAQPAAAAPCHCRPILHRQSYTAPRLHTAPQPARHLVAKGGRSTPRLPLEPSAPAVTRAGGPPSHTAHCPAPLPRSAPR